MPLNNPVWSVIYKSQATKLFILYCIVKSSPARLCLQIMQGVTARRFMLRSVTERPQRLLDNPKLQIKPSTLVFSFQLTEHCSSRILQQETNSIAISAKFVSQFCLIWQKIHCISNSLTLFKLWTCCLGFHLESVTSLSELLCYLHYAHIVSLCYENLIKNTAQHFWKKHTQY